MPPRSPELLVPNASAWRQWLARESLTTPVIWLVVARKGSNTGPSLSYAEALDEALCFGWIDSGGCPRDETTRYLRFGPRKPKSPWSQRNIGYIERLEREGRMAEPGLAAVAQAKANGLWDAAYGAGNAPQDLMAAIGRWPRAQAAWDSMAKGERYKIFVRMGSLPIPSAAREKKIAAIVDSLRGSEDVPVLSEMEASKVEVKDTSSAPVELRKGTRSSARLQKAALGQVSNTSIPNNNTML